MTKTKNWNKTGPINARCHWDALGSNCFLWQQSVSSVVVEAPALLGLLWRAYCTDEVHLDPPDLSGRVKTSLQLLWNILPCFPCTKIQQQCNASNLIRAEFNPHLSLPYWDFRIQSFPYFVQSKCNVVAIISAKPMHWSFPAPFKLMENFLLILFGIHWNSVKRNEFFSTCIIF